MRHEPQPSKIGKRWIYAKKQKNLQNCDFSDDDLMNKQILKNILTKLQNLEQKVIPMPSQNLTEKTMPKALHKIDSTSITGKDTDLNVTIPAAKDAVEEGTLERYVI